LALLPRFLTANNQAERTARIQLTGISITGCCSPGEYVANSDVHVSNLISDGSNFSQFINSTGAVQTLSTGLSSIPDPSESNIYFLRKLIVGEDLIIENAHLVFEAPAYIEVMSGRTLTIHHSLLRGCMQWEGIVVHPGANLHIDPDVEIYNTLPKLIDPTSTWLRQN